MGSPRGETFALSAKAMAAAKTIPDWTVYRYLKARRDLVVSGFIECVEPGGKRPGDASKYWLVINAIGYGCENRTQCNSTRPRRGILAANS